MNDANSLIPFLPPRLASNHATLASLASSYALPPTAIPSQGLLPGSPSTGSPAIRMDFSGLGQLLLSLIPSLTHADLDYFAALFDLDGDGLVSPDDIMDAFEEAGTTINVLQTPAHKVSRKDLPLP